MDHLHYLNVLAKIAETVEPVANARIAAGIVYKRDFLSMGINRRKSHPLQKTHGKNEDSIYLHAENDAIVTVLRSGADLSRCTLYVARVKWLDTERSTLVWGRSRPCIGCMSAIKTYKIPRVVYTEDLNTFSVYLAST